MNLVSDETPPSAKRFRLDLQNNLDQPHFAENNNQHNDDNIGTTSALSYDENNDEFRLKLESESIDTKSDYINFDENNEKCRRKENISSLIQHYHNAAELNVDNNYNNDKNNSLSSSKEDVANIELPPVELDFLKFINNNKSSSIDNKNGKKDALYCFDSLLSSSQQLNTNVAFNKNNINNNNNNSNSFPMALLNAINFLKPNDNSFKSVTGRRSNGSSSSISMSPPPSSTLVNLSNTNNAKLNLNKEHSLPNATNNTANADSTMLDLSLAMSLFQQASSLFNNNNISNKNNNNTNKNVRAFNNDIKAAAANLLNCGISSPSSQRSRNTTPGATNGASPTPVPIPGAVAVAASPAAILFSQDDWSWHRNPAASIRSGGTNKQTPVWKYFVYNKAENLSRCIVGTCTYTLKGPHTSTLACHLKKHPLQYTEFQKLKLHFQAAYTRERNTGQINTNMELSKNSSSSLPSAFPLSTASASSSGIIAPVSNSSSSSPSTTNTGGLDLIRKLNNLVKNDGLINTQFNTNNIKGNNNINNITAFNLAYAAAANNNNIKPSNEKTTNFSLPYNNIFSNRSLNNNNFLVDFSETMTTFSPINNNEDKNVNVKTTNQLLLNLNNHNVTNLKKVNQSSNKSGALMSDILAALNKRAAAAAAAVSTNTEESTSCLNQINCVDSSNFTSLTSKMSQSLSPTSEILNEKNNQSKFPTLERLFFSDENNKNETLNKTTTSNIDETPSKIFHSALDLAESSIKSENMKNDDLNENSSGSISRDSPISLSQYQIDNTQQKQLVKCQYDENYQSEVELKLALALNSLGLPLTVIQNSFLIELFETAQPKFVMPSSVDKMEKILTNEYEKTISTISLHLKSTKQSKISLIVNVFQNNQLNKSTNFNNQLNICIYASFYSTIFHSNIIALLGARSVQFNLKKEYLLNVQILIEEVLKKYNLKMSKISRILISTNFKCVEENYLFNTISNFDSQKDYSSRLIKPIGAIFALCLDNVFDLNDKVVLFKQSFYTFLTELESRHNFNTQLQKLSDNNIDLTSLLSSSNSFYFLAKQIIKNKDVVISLLSCNKEQNQIDDSKTLFDDEQWAFLAEIVQLVSLFQKYFIGIDEGVKYQIELNDKNKIKNVLKTISIDSIIPALIEIQFALKNNFQLINNLSNQLHDVISSKCAHIMEINSSEFDEIFIQATALNPLFAKKYLSKKQIDFAKSSIKNIIQKRIQNAVSTTDCNNEFENVITADKNKYFKPFKTNDESISLKSTGMYYDNENIDKCSNSFLVCSNLVNPANKNICESNTNKNELAEKYEQIVDLYFDKIDETQLENNNENINEYKFVYWEKNSTKYLFLSDFAIELFCIPATQISSDLVFDKNYLKNNNYFENLNEQTFPLVCKKIEQSAILRLNRQFLI